jgi:predicted DNA-binding mobile mystery protein A
MEKRFQKLRLSQVDISLARWRTASLPPKPSDGWCSSIRQALGMTATALARRLNITNSGLRTLEKAEAHEAITLASLRKLAQALDCELQYAFVPKTSLEQRLQSRAQELARKQLQPVSHSMLLEDQSVHGKSKNLQIELLAQELLDGPRRNFW